MLNMPATVKDYMQAIKENLSNHVILTSLNYNKSDKDMGYRSGLRYLGIEMTEETDEIARSMIYPNHCFHAVKKQDLSPQLSLF